MPTYLGDRLLLIPQSPACLLLRKLEAKVSNIFCSDGKIYGQSEGDPVDLTGGEKAILPAWILRNAKGDLHGLFRARSEVYSVDSPRLFVRSWVPITLARGQEREFQCLVVDEKPNALEFRCGSRGCMAGLHNAFRSGSS
jgi:hypothetical protein